ncbi:aerobic fumarate hydratase class I [Pseudescherichia vulneris NBRC 102420]|uniref:Fumarate hydratase class I n=1 Tax=Pseudescherichia vulneris NBRC 102420 TaxID=1115515 RepID=A0A090V6F8_PSEVU|nr:FumA C-terminus/TtdB family hydratase beta subunit [Pseudescherichia vulneris]GAL58839.1 aerobic fumarate hydratase class I [Pseudescherichia vulneris NBRC 102420]
MNKPFIWQDPFPHDKDLTEYYLLSDQYVSIIEADNKTLIAVDPKGLMVLAKLAFYEASFFLRTAHIKQVASILHDREASANDRYVALQLLRNAEVSAKGILPYCQDTGTATIVAEKGQSIWTGCNDAEALSLGIYETFQEHSLRYSQNAPLDMYTEVNTGTNLPAQIDIAAIPGDEYKFLFINKGGGSANKAALFQETKSILAPEKLVPFLIAKMQALGTAACPPYHIAFVIGGTSPEHAMKVAKLASTKYYDTLPTRGNEHGQAFRDLHLEATLLNASRTLGIGAQFGGKYFAHDIRVIRLPRHGGSCPIALALSCSADRNIKGKINRHGLWLEKLERDPGRFIPETLRMPGDSTGVRINLNRPLREVMHELSRYTVGTRLSLSGPLVVARDIAHAKLKARLDAGVALPDYMKNYIVYYAGPAKTPEGGIAGSLGPTTGGRMDGYVDAFQAAGGSLVMLSKGNRSQQVTDACARHGGFNLGSIGGAAALLAQDYVRSLRCLEYAELGMEAVWMMEVKDMPAFILVDDKGNNFYQQFEQRHDCNLCPSQSLK